MVRGETRISNFMRCWMVFCVTMHAVFKYCNVVQYPILD